MDTSKLNYVPPAPIILEDNDEDAPECWAANVRVGECTIVTGDQGQRFACWNIVITTSASATVNLRKRYSELDTLRENLKKELPNVEIPKLPPKRVVKNLESRFLAKRRAGIEWFLSCVLLNPTFANTKSIRDFVVPK